MYCEKHPAFKNRKKCLKCGKGFCEKCEVETGQQAYCSDCYMEMVMRLASGKEGKKRKPSPGVKRGKKKSEKQPEHAVERAAETSLSASKEEREQQPTVREETADEAMRVLKSEKQPAVESILRRVSPVKRDAPSRKKKAGDEGIIEDVMSVLIGSEEESATATEASTQQITSSVLVAKEDSKKEGKEKKGKEKKHSKAGDFLAQERIFENTSIAENWWKTALFFAAVIFAGIALWALPRVYILPGRVESLYMLMIGLATGLVFWWKAGKAHSTKLAVQAAASVFVIVVLGEWISQILWLQSKIPILKIIQFWDLMDIIIKEWATLITEFAKSIFSPHFGVILFGSCFIAFVVGFGMPPIPEMFYSRNNMNSESRV